MWLKQWKPSKPTQKGSFEEAKNPEKSGNFDPVYTKEICILASRIEALHDSWDFWHKIYFLDSVAQNLIRQLQNKNCYFGRRRRRRRRITEGRRQNVIEKYFIKTYLFINKSCHMHLNRIHQLRFPFSLLKTLFMDIVISAYDSAGSRRETNGGLQ